LALPGGRVYLLDGLLRRAQDADEVAGILAHELGTLLQRFKGSTYVPIHRARGPVHGTSLCLTRPCRPKMCWTRELASSHDPY
jgi:hypothetical protein